MGRYIARDSYLGVKKTGLRILFYALVIIILTYTGILEVDWMNMNSYGWAGIISGKLLCGVEEYNIQYGSLNPPIEWITMMMIVIYVFADYLYDDMNGFGVQKITRLGKNRWFVSKCIWIVEEAIICVSLLYLIPLIVTYLKYGSIVSASRDELLNLTGFYGMLKDKSNFYLSFVFVPAFCCLTIAVWTAVLGMLLEPAKAFMCMSIYIVVGVYYMSPYLIGNQMMLSRNPYINPDGSGVMESLWIDIVLIIGGFVCGYLYVSNKDYIEMRKG